MGFGKGPFGKDPFGEWKWSRRVLYEYIPEIYRQLDQEAEGLLETFTEGLRPSFRSLRRNIRDLDNLRGPLGVRTSDNDTALFKLGPVVKKVGELEQRGINGRIDATGQFVAPSGRFSSQSIGKELTIFNSSFAHNNVTTVITSVANSTTVSTADILATDAGPITWELRPAVERDTSKVTIEIRSGDVSAIQPGWTLWDGGSKFTILARRQFPLVADSPLYLTLREGSDGTINGSGNFVSSSINFSQRDVGRLISVSTSVIPDNNNRWEVIELVSATEAIVQDQLGNPPQTDSVPFFWAVLPDAQVDISGQAIPGGVISKEGLQGEVTAANTFKINSEIFEASDVGKLLTIRGADNAGNNLTTTITAVNGSEATVSDTLTFPDNGIFTPPSADPSIGWEIREPTAVGSNSIQVRVRPTSLITNLAPDFGIEIDTQESESRQRAWVENVAKWIKRKGTPKAYEILGTLSGFNVTAGKLYRMAPDLALSLSGVLEVGESDSSRSGTDGTLSQSGTRSRFTSPTALFSVGDEGSHIRVQGASVAANNIIFTIENFVDANTVEFRLADQATLPEANNGSLTWALVRLYHPNPPLLPRFDEFDADFMEALIDGFAPQTTDKFGIDKYCWESDFFSDVAIEISSVTQIDPGVFEVQTIDGPAQGPSSVVGNATVIVAVGNWVLIDSNNDEFFVETVPTSASPYTFEVKAAVGPVVGSATLRYRCPEQLSCNYCASHRVLVTVEATSALLDEGGVAVEQATPRLLKRLEDVVPAHVVMVPKIIQPFETSSSWAARGLPSIDGLWVAEDPKIHEVGVVLNDRIGSNDFTVTGGTVVHTSSPVGGGFELADADATVQITSTTYLAAPASTSISIFALVWVPDAIGGGSSIVSKRTTANSFEGWQIQCNPAGTLQAVLDPGAAGETILVLSHDYRGRWVPIVMVVDRGTDNLHFETDLGTNSVSIAGLGDVDAAAQPLTIGDPGFAPPEPGTIIASMASVEGQAWDSAERSAIIQYFTDLVT